MTRQTWTFLALLAGALLFAGWRHRDATFARAESARLGKALDSLSKVKRRVDSIYVRDTIRLRREVVRFDSAVVEVERWKHDTVRVVEFVERADSTVRACLAVVESCEERVNARDAQLTALRAKARADLAVIQARVPSRMDRLRGAVVWAGAGYLAGRITP